MEHQPPRQHRSETAAKGARPAAAGAPSSAPRESVVFASFAVVTASATMSGVGRSEASGCGPSPGEGLRASLPSYLSSAAAESAACKFEFIFRHLDLDGPIVLRHVGRPVRRLRMPLIRLTHFTDDFHETTTTSSNESGSRRPSVVRYLFPTNVAAVSFDENDASIRIVPAPARSADASAVGVPSLLTIAHLDRSSPLAAGVPWGGMRHVTLMQWSANAEQAATMFRRWYDFTGATAAMLEPDQSSASAGEGGGREANSKATKHAAVGMPLVDVLSPALDVLTTHPRDTVSGASWGVRAGPSAGDSSPGDDGGKAASLVGSLVEGSAASSSSAASAAASSAAASAASASASDFPALHTDTSAHHNDVQAPQQQHSFFHSQPEIFPHPSHPSSLYHAGVTGFGPSPAVLHPYAAQQGYRQWAFNGYGAQLAQPPLPPVPPPPHTTPSRGGRAAPYTAPPSLSIAASSSSASFASYDLGRAPTGSYEGFGAAHAAAGGLQPRAPTSPTSSHIGEPYAAQRHPPPADVGSSAATAGAHGLYVMIPSAGSSGPQPHQHSVSYSLISPQQGHGASAAVAAAPPLVFPHPNYQQPAASHPHPPSSVAGYAAAAAAHAGHGLATGIMYNPFVTPSSGDSPPPPPPPLGQPFAPGATLSPPSSTYAAAAGESAAPYLFPPGSSWVLVPSPRAPGGYMWALVPSSLSQQTAAVSPPPLPQYATRYR